ncbi:RNA polymerase sigma factor [Sphingobacterium sp. SYP-B4668]|uniref:RNA polymerase sigma factor n=1 Tax=Sphingobacterium sp. SYP-B4668 TaxID=2996035 RepID=UPI0022DD4EB2|nr:RNA polymerase sigma-70 factor [Sphingobacterium sp. SYP-B4668]
MYSYHTLSDIALFQLIQHQDRRAFEIIYDRYFSLLYIYAKKIIANDEEVEDVLQDVFLALWEKQDISLEKSFSSYVYGMTRFKILDFIDRKKVRSQYAASLQHYIEEGACITDDKLREKELAKQIESALQLLPEKMRNIFLLSRFENKSYREIADKLQLSDKTIKKQISNALKIMRTALKTFLMFLY